MEELVNLVVKKTGISHQDAETAVKVVIDFVKSKLPAPIAAQVDGVLNSGGADGIIKGLEGLLGK